MCKYEKSIFEIIGTFYEYEYGEEKDDYKAYLLQDIEDDFVSLAHSEIGSITDFSAATIYIPSEKAVVKNIFSFEYQQSFEEKLFFQDNDALEKYLMGTSFDELLEPKIEEDILIEICKSA